MITTQGSSQRITTANPGHGGRAVAPAIAFLGTGGMGGPMAANLARAGFDVRAWDRTATRASALADDGASPAASPAEAVRGAGILITMLADGPATEQVWNGLGGPTAGPGLIWVQMATVGMEWTQRLADAAARSGVNFVDAPVSGSRGPAEAGQLTILASGPDWVQDVLAGALLPRWRRAAAAGHADDDLAAIYTTPLSVEPEGSPQP